MDPGNSLEKGMPSASSSDDSIEEFNLRVHDTMIEDTVGTLCISEPVSGVASKQLLSHNSMQNGESVDDIITHPSVEADMVRLAAAYDDVMLQILAKQHEWRALGLKVPSAIQKACFTVTMHNFLDIYASYSTSITAQSVERRVPDLDNQNNLTAVVLWEDNAADTQMELGIDDLKSDLFALATAYASLINQVHDAQRKWSECGYKVPYEVETACIVAAIYNHFDYGLLCSIHNSRRRATARSAGKVSSTSAGDTTRQSDIPLCAASIKVSKGTAPENLAIADLDDSSSTDGSDGASSADRADEPDLDDLRDTDGPSSAGGEHGDDHPILRDTDGASSAGSDNEDDLLVPGDHVMDLANEWNHLVDVILAMQKNWRAFNWHVPFVVQDMCDAVTRDNAFFFGHLQREYHDNAAAAQAMSDIEDEPELDVHMDGVDFKSDIHDLCELWEDLVDLVDNMEAEWFTEGYVVLPALQESCNKINAINAFDYPAFHDYHIKYMADLKKKAATANLPQICNGTVDNHSAQPGTPVATTTIPTSQDGVASASHPSLKSVLDNGPLRTCDQFL